ARSFAHAPPCRAKAGGGARARRPQRGRRAGAQARAHAARSTAFPRHALHVRPARVNDKSPRRHDGRPAAAVRGGYTPRGRAAPRSIDDGRVVHARAGRGILRMERLVPSRWIAFRTKWLGTSRSTQRPLDRLYARAPTSGVRPKLLPLAVLAWCAPLAAAEL